MTVDEALAAIFELDHDPNNLMRSAVLRLGRVPEWVENELIFSRVRSPDLTGNTAGNAALCEDILYHGCACDSSSMLSEQYEKSVDGACG